MSYKAAELKALPDLPLDHLSGYVNIPQGFVLKIGKDYATHTLFNPETLHVIVYTYSESVCYVDGPNDAQYNGRYTEADTYIAGDL